MQTSDFVKLLQNELILSRDPHTADRFSALLDEHYVPIGVTDDPTDSSPVTDSSNGTDSSASSESEAQ